MPDSRLFANERLEKLTRTNIGAFCITWSGILVLLGLLGFHGLHFVVGLSAVVVGLVAWTLVEYFVHRSLFHLEPGSDRMNMILFMTHGVHHQDPNDDTRNLIPLAVSLPIAAALWWLGYAIALLAGIPEIGEAFMFGFLGGYVVYDLVHYACHQWPMRHPLLRAVKKHHMRHHFTDADRNFGVSTGLWDFVFGTLHRPRAN